MARLPACPSSPLQRLAAILNNAFNAAAVPPLDSGCGSYEDTDLSSGLDATDGYSERPVDRK